MTADPQGRSHPPYRRDTLAAAMLSAMDASKAAKSARSTIGRSNSIGPGVVTLGPVGPSRPSRRARVRPPYQVVRVPIRHPIFRWLHAVPVSVRTPIGVQHCVSGHNLPQRLITYVSLYAYDIAAEAATLC